LALKGKDRVEGYSQCVSACKVLLDKLSGMRFPWRLVLFLLLAAVAGLLAFDIYDNDGFERSRTNKFLSDTGVIVFSQQVGQRVSLYSEKGYTWLRVNVPLYYQKTCDTVGPYMVAGLEKCQEGGVWVVNVTQPHRDWVKEKVPQAIEWVQTKAPTLVDSCQYYAIEAWHFTVETSLWTWQHICASATATGVWLRENVFKEAIAGCVVAETQQASDDDTNAEVPAATNGDPTGDPTGETNGDPSADPSVDPSGDANDAPTDEANVDPTGDAIEPSGDAIEPSGDTNEPTGDTIEPTGDTNEPSGDVEAASEPSGDAPHEEL